MQETDSNQAVKCNPPPPEKGQIASRSGVNCCEYGLDDLQLLKASWLRLHHRVDSASVFNSWEWTSAWWKHFSTSYPEGTAKLLVIGVWIADDLIAVASLGYPSKFGQRVNRLRVLGDLEAKESMTEMPALLCLPEYEHESVAAIKNYLTSPSSVGRWDCAVFRIVDQCNEYVTAAALGNEIEPRKFAVQRIAELPDTWEKYRLTLSRSMKTNITYYPRKLSKNGINWQFIVARNSDEVAVAMPDLIRLHRERAKSKRGTHHTNHIPGRLHEGFLQEVLPLLADSGQAWIAMITVDGKTVASQAFLQTKQTLTFYYSGYDQSFYDYSLLLILATQVIKDAIDEGIKWLNFLPDILDSSGNETTSPDWKTRWRAEASSAIIESVLYPTHGRAKMIKKIRSIKSSIQKLYLDSSQAG